MTLFPNHTLDSAPAVSKPILQQLQAKFGFLPNLFATFAESPATLKAYLALSDAFAATTLTPKEQQVVAIAASAENGCEFCVSAHSFIALNLVKLDEASLQALRARAQLPDAKLDALATFTRRVVNERGWVDAAHVQAFVAAGYTPAQALEVIVGVAMKTLSNYVNHIAGTPLNPQFESQRWTRSAKAA